MSKQSTGRNVFRGFQSKVQHKPSYKQQEVTKISDKHKGEGLYYQKQIIKALMMCIFFFFEMEKGLN